MQRDLRRIAGFTLIELLVVIIIIALAMTAVPRMMAGLPVVRLRATADDLVDRIKELHNEALRRGATVELALDPATRSYTTSLELHVQTLPDVISAVSVVTPTGLLARSTAHILFFGDGTATAETILLRHGRQSTSITIDWLTGRVQRDD